MKLLRSVVTSAILVLGSIVPLVGQQPCLTKRDVVIKKDKPTVYLSLERDDRTSITQSAVSRTKTNGDKSRLFINTAALVWLRLHNNTQWSISFVTDASYWATSEHSREQICISRGIDVLLDGTKVSLPYQVETMPDYGGKYTIDGKTLPDYSNSQTPVLQPPANQTTDWLLPGRSVVFAVRGEHLSDGLMIFVKFNYEWENDGKDRVYNEPQHRVYFRGVDIPR